MKMLRIKKRVISISVTILTLSFFIILMIVANVAPFGNYSFAGYDCLQQYIPFFSELHEKYIGLFSESGSIMYSWNGGLGYNFLAVFFYYLSSPLNIIVAFFDRNSLTALISVLIVVKASLASGSFSFYLLNRREKYKSVSEYNLGEIFITIALAMGYALSGYILGFYYNVMWLDCFALFPFIILGLEKIISGKSPAFYMVMLFFSIWCNYYISFMICLFLSLWFFINVWNSKEGFVRTLGRFVFSSIIAVCMAGIPIIVSAYALSVTQTAHYGMYGNVWYTNIFRILGEQMIFSRPVLAVPYNGVANIYCGMLAVVLMFVYIVSKISLREKIMHIALLVVLLVSMDYDPLNYVWHGFHEQNGIPNRFSFCFIFVLLVIGYDTCFKIEKNRIGVTAVSLISALIYPIICFVFYDFDGMISSTNMVLVAFILVMIYGSLIAIINVKPIWKTKVISIMAIIMIIELLVNGFVCMTKNELDETGYYMSYVDARNCNIDNIDKENFGKKDFYRETVYDNIIDNEDTYHSIKGVNLFSSMQYGGIVNSMGNLGFKYSVNQYYYLGATGITDDLLGVRYIHMMNDYYSGKTGYGESSDDVGNIVYSNPDALSIAYAVNKDVLSYDISTECDSMLIQNNLLYSMTGIGGHFKPVDVGLEVEGIDCEARVVTGQPNVVTVVSDGVSMATFSFGFTALEDGEYCIKSFNENLNDGALYVNGKLIESNEIYNRIVSVQLSAGDQVQIVLQCLASGYTENIVPVFISRYFPENEKKAIAKLKEGEMQINSIGDGNIQGDVTIKEEQILFTSIPFDKGWKIYDNGVKIDSIELLGGFLGVQLSPGYHSIEFRYETPGLKLGMLITILGWGLFFVIIYMKNRKEKSKKNSVEG